MRAEIPHLTPAQWQSDIRLLADAVPKTHKNAFHHTSKAEFGREVARLLKLAEHGSDPAIVVGIQRLVASLGDGHSGLSTMGLFRSYPLELMYLDGEIRVIRAGAGFEKAIGARVLAIDGTPIAEAQRRVLPLISQAENQWWIRDQQPRKLVVAENLFATGIAHDVDGANFTLQRDGGRPIDLVIPSVPAGTSIDWREITPLPLSRTHTDQSFWFTDLPGTKAVYVNFRNYSDLAENARALFDHVDAVGAKALVFDLRFNGGGNFTLPRRFIIPEIRRRATLMAPGHLYVLVGRHTFSAAMTNAIDFKRDLKATLVGEPIGARPNGYQENGMITLPQSNLRVSVSTLYYQFWPTNIAALKPDVSRPPNWGAVRSGRDSALTYAIAQLRQNGRR
ncbi:MAG: hypothetical protein H0W65_08225 [Sphingomonas sp.]|uniref:S41 family peptidase n=1 Tax=Sphingomonas sp. TaxID=28214 RepID=UPI0017E5E44E|nr:hypothetical protein [Sphingomonas sp.]MBA3667694.1 hypothetical protein [Sphingomonas sp.]